jgi:hypothetical protein
VKPINRLFVFFCLTLVIAGALFSCGPKKSNDGSAVVENLYEDSISTSYTIALADPKGEGMRITYTFFNMKRADTGNYKMTHVYMRHTGTDDTTIVNGTWKLEKTDSGSFILAYSGRSVKRLDYSGELNLFTLNTDSMIADTGLLQFRRKKDNDMRNSTVHLFGKVVFKENKNAEFLDVNGDTIPILKISAFGELVELNDSIDLDSPGIRGVEVLGTIQIRMAMDGKSTKRSLIVEEIVGVKK